MAMERVQEEMRVAADTMSAAADTVRKEATAAQRDENKSRQSYEHGRKAAEMPPHSTIRRAGADPADLAAGETPLTAITGAAQRLERLARDANTRADNSVGGLAAVLDMLADVLEGAAEDVRSAMGSMGRVRLDMDDDGADVTYWTVAAAEAAPRREAAARLAAERAEMAKGTVRTVEAVVWLVRHMADLDKSLTVAAAEATARAARDADTVRQRANDMAGHRTAYKSKHAQ